MTVSEPDPTPELGPPRTKYITEASDTEGDVVVGLILVLVTYVDEKESRF